MKNIFTEHPKTINETYFQHFKFAISFGFNMIIGGLACSIHAIFPFLFEKTGSHFLIKMMYNFVERMQSIEDQRIVELSALINRKTIKK